MSTQTHEELIPRLTLRWRLAMALDKSGLSVEAMAQQLGVNRRTVSRWINDDEAPMRRVYKLQWALITGVPIEWLESGEMPTNGGGDDDGGQVISTDGTVTNRYPFAVNRRFLPQAS